MQERIFLGDLASKVAESLNVSIDPRISDNEEKSLAPKIRFSWRPEDSRALDFIREASDAAMANAFSDLLYVIDELYCSLRVARTNDDGVILRDGDGRILWKTDDNGYPLEIWDQLTGQDIEEALTRLYNLKISVSSQVNELMLEALYARNVASDAYDDTWGKVLDGTQGDRSAKSSRESRPDRYHAYFRFYLYSRAKTILDDISATIKHLENLRYWQVRSQRT